MEEAFLDDKVPSNDLELFLETAKIVGKENIVVKLHPRNKENRFEKIWNTYNETYIGSMGIISYGT